MASFRNKPLLIAAALLTGAVLALPVRSAPQEFGSAAAPDGVRARFMLGAGISLDQAIQMAERQFSARVVRASVSEDHGRRVYVLRLVSEQGRVWTVRVDAASGSMM